MEEETYFNIDKLFDIQNLEKFEKNEDKDKDYSLSELLTWAFNSYFFPKNILTGKPYEDRSHLSLDKFKEKNIRNAKEDMMYYCTPVDILAKLDGQNSGYAAIESQNEFVEDLGIVSFLQNEKIIEKNIKDEFQAEKIRKHKSSINWNKKLDNNGNNIDENIIDKCNKIIILIQNTMKKFSAKNIKQEEIMENINQIILETKNNQVTLEKIGFKMLIILENNLLFLFGLLDKYFRKETEDMCKFLEKYLELFNIIKSNRIFFAVIQYLNKNENISKQIKIDKPFELFSKNCINISEIINNIDNNKYEIIENKLILPNPSKSFDLSSEKEKDTSNLIKCDYYVMNNTEEIFIFKIAELEPKIKILFYRINLRNEENEINNDISKLDKDGNLRLLDFGEIYLEKNEGDDIIDINISIKNDLIYVCSFINKKLKDSGNELKVANFELDYKIYTTSMSLIKEDKIKLNNFECQNASLCSDKNNLYIITNENKIFVMKKEYSMNSFQQYEFSIKNENKDISITDYKYYNSFNLENLLILENRKDINDLLLVQVEQENNKYIFNLFPIKQNTSNQVFKYIFSYNESMFVFIKINNDEIYFSYTDAYNTKFFETDLKFVSFESSLIKDAYKQDQTNDLYRKLIKNYAYYVNLYGNFDEIDLEKIELTNFPFSLSFNINTNNMNFIIEQLLNCKDIEMSYYYIIILKQFLCCIYKADLLKDETFTKVLEYFKNFVSNIKTDKDKRFRIKILKEIIFISAYFNDKNIIEIEDIEKLLSIKDEKKDIKINLLLLDLLLTQPKTQQNEKVYELIYDYEKKFFSYIYQEKINPALENKIISSLFKLYKKVMLKAMVLIDNFYLNIDDKLFSYIKKIADNVAYICNLYKNIRETKIGKMPFLFNSVNFSFFFMIIHIRIINTGFEKNFEIFSSLYNALITLDKLNINKNMNKALDLNNLVEITNSKAESIVDDNDISIKVINFKSRQNITLRSNFINYVGTVNLKSYFEKILLIRKNKDSKEEKIDIDINHCIDDIFYDVDGLEIHIKENIDFNWRVILDIIPIKDINEFLEIKYNDNNRLINLIQKTLLYYFLSLFKSVISKININLKKDKIKNFCKSYHNEFLQFIYTDKIDIDMSLFEKKEGVKSDKKKENGEEKKEDIFSLTSLIYNFKNDLKNSLNLCKNEENKENNKDQNDTNTIMELLNKFISFFGDFNKGENKNVINFESYYNKADITLNQIKSYKEINLEDKSYEKLFEQFEKNIAKKNKILSSLRANESIKKIILKIFQIIIKYYNYNSKFLDLIKKENFTSENEDYTLFLDIYEKCSKMKMIYNQEKSRFVDEKFEEQSQNYFKVTSAKLDFLYQIIIPSFNENLKYDKYIVQNLIELIKNESFNPKELLQYSEIQNINCNIKVIEMIIINNLLLNLKDEENIKLILHTINDLYNKNKENSNYSISMSLLDSIYGADYSQMQQVKNQFHLLIGIILEKYIKNKNNNENLGITTKILLYQTLLWKYKGRDFHIMPKILSSFDDLKKLELDKSKIIFDLKHDKIHRINNYNLETFNDIKFEIFKIITSQIFWKIKENAENNKLTKDLNAELNLKRSLSNIDNSDSIANLLMSFFLTIQQNNKYYFDLILFFYKNIINSRKLINILNTESFSGVIVKILKIIFDDEKPCQNSEISTEKNNYTKFIILKLFLQILENVDNEDKILNLFECCSDYDKNAFNENEEESNPFIYLTIKFNNMISKEQCPFLKQYYLKLLLFCLNKIDKSESLIEKNKLLDINFILTLDENLNQFESKFYVKDNAGNKFEEFALFSSDEKLKSLKSGTLLCYNRENNLFKKYLESQDISHFDYNDFQFIIQQNKNCENMIVIMDEALNENNYEKENNLSDKNSNDIILIPGQNNNQFYNKYLEKNSGYIYEKLFGLLIENKINYKGINYILKMIYNLLDYITIENAERLIKYIFDYISDKNVEENNNEFNFSSFEYIDNEINSFKNVFYSQSFDINKEIKKEKDIKENKDEEKPVKEAPLLLSCLFNYSIINDKDFYIEYKSNKNMNKSFLKKLELVNVDINKQKEKREINITNLSFYKSSPINDLTYINDNSLLLTIKLSPDEELLKIIQENPGKIKAIIASDIDDSKKEEYDQFLKKINIPIYSVSIHFYNKLTKFFIDGNGGSYIGTNKNDESNMIPIYYPSLYCKFKSSENKEKEINIKKDNLQGSQISIKSQNDNNYFDEDLCLDILFNEETTNVQLDENKINEYLMQNKKDILNRKKEIEFDISKIFCLENVKICHRILYELLQKTDIINKMNNDILLKNIDILIDIFDSLCKEYYSNINQNIPIYKLQNLLKNYLKSLVKLDKLGKKWSQCIIQSIHNIIVKLNETKKEEGKDKENKEEKVDEKINKKNLKNELSSDMSESDKSKVSLEDENDDESISINIKKMRNKNYNKISCYANDKTTFENCKKYDILLFIFKNCSEVIFDEYSLNICFEIINQILEQSNKKKLNIIKSLYNEFISSFLFEVMDSIYKIIINNKHNSKLFINYFINNNKIHDLMIQFIDRAIEIKSYFLNEEEKKNKKTIPKSKTLLIQFGFRYLDICIYIFLKEKQGNIFRYWIKSKNEFFKFYSSYKLLATDLHYEEADYKELLSILAYISDSISSFEKSDIDKNNLDKKIIQMKSNEFNKVKLDFKKDAKTHINLTSFSFDNLKNSKDSNINFSKLAIFSLNKKEDKYNLLDIIDCSEFSSMKSLKNYIQIFNAEEIYLVPLENLSTSLYAFGSNFNHSLGIGGKLAKFYDKPTKCQGLPNNIWNIGYGNNYCLALDEKNKKIYACGCNKGGGFNSTPRASFTDDTKINKNKNSEDVNKFVNFATGNCDSTLLMNEKGELFGIGNNEEKIFGFEDEKKIKYPQKLDMKIWTKKEDEDDNEKENKNEIKEELIIKNIKSFYIGYQNSYIIDNEGKLYGIGKNENYQISSDEDRTSYTTWRNIPLPENCTKFVDVVVGECFILCLIEDKDGNNKLYAKGKNNLNQCGVSSKEKNIKNLTMCDNSKNMNFKKIFARNKEAAAITTDGNLYMINMYQGQALTLISFNENDNLKNKNNSEKKENKDKNEIKDINEIEEENDKQEGQKIIVDDVALSLSHMLIIARQYDKEKGVYIKKLFGLGDNSKGALGLPIKTDKDENTIYTITEIPLLDENNKKLIPIKLTIGKDKSYVLCVDEEELIQNIKNNNKKEKVNYAINISNKSIEREENNILNFYYSKNIDSFINIFRTISNKVISSFIESIDEIKMNNQDLIDKGIMLSVTYQMFYEYITKHQKLKELSHIFIQSNVSEKEININKGINPELESIFNYLKTKMKFITTDIFKYCSTNEISEYKQFLQKVIGNNISYLNAQLRLDRFNELFSKLTRRRGGDYDMDVDRFKANKFYDKFNEDPKNKVPDIELKETIFGQVFQRLNDVRGENFLLQKDKRLFVVNLKNEYASDSGGPYHEVISGMCQELQSDYLDMFIKTPNNKNDIGLLRDKYIPNPDAKRKIYEKGYEFLGKMMASSVASNEVLDLNLHPILWQGLLGNEITFYDYENIDITFFSLINNLEAELKQAMESEEKKDESQDNISTQNTIRIFRPEENEKFKEKYNLNFVIKNSNGGDIILKPEGEKIPVTLDNLNEYITLSKKMRTSEFETQIEFIKNGFNSVIPSSIFQHLYWRQLEEMVCGKATLDIRALKENTRYEDFKKDDEVIKWFWEWLEKCSDHEKSLYLKFVCGRTRLPKDKNFSYNHIIKRNYYNDKDSFPHSATCFFTLKLPVYKDRETLEKRMNYAILNCDEIDAD